MRPLFALSVFDLSHASSIALIYCLADFVGAAKNALKRIIFGAKKSFDSRNLATNAQR